jgi:hypothetical protein
MTNKLNERIEETIPEKVQRIMARYFSANDASQVQHLVDANKAILSLDLDHDIKEAMTFFLSHGYDEYWRAHREAVR